MKKCDRCNVKHRYGSNRYCKECTKVVKMSLAESGYLTKPPGRVYRPSHATEDTRDTKFGIDR
jgi:hypothetical protein